MKDVYLHIGLPKTGSTSLQSFCLANDQYLKDNDIFYPSVLDGFYGHSHLSALRIEAFGLKNRAYQSIDSIVEEVKAAPQQKAIISEEIFCEQIASDFHQIFKNFNVKVVVYLRSPALLEASAIQFEVQSFLYDSYSPHGISPTRCVEEENILSRSYLLFSKLKNNWISKIPLDKFIFKDFDQLSKANLLIEDFFSMLGLQIGNSCDHNYSRSNSSLKTDYLFFLAHSNLVPLSFLERINLLKNLERLSAEDICSKYYSLLSKSGLKNISTNKLNIFEEIGSLIGRLDFLPSGINELNKLDEVPYVDLPIHLQHAIYAKLDEEIRKSINVAWPASTCAALDEAVFPPLPKNQVDVDFLTKWHAALTRCTRN